MNELKIRLEKDIHNNIFYSIWNGNVLKCGHLTDKFKILSIIKNVITEWL